MPDDLTDDGYKKRISRDEYLRAFAMFIMANDYSLRCYEVEWALNRMIRPGSTDFSGGHIGDAIYSSERATQAGFDEALRREGIEVDDGAQS